MKRILAILYRFRRLMVVACVLGWVAALVATHVPGQDLPEFHVSDKTLHVVGYFGLATLFWFALTAYGVRFGIRLTVVICVLVTYGAVDEITQAPFHRSPEVGDWVGDVVGIVLASLAWEVIFRLGRGRQPQSADPQAAKPPYDQYPY
ncbi:MAG: VanZ family protein [Phycisphaerae bacterium]|jgi:VanZ family protein